MVSVKKAWKVLPVLGIAIFAWIISRLDLNEVVDVAAKTRWYLVLVSLAIGLVAVYVKAFKWKKIVDYSGMHYSSYKSFIAWLVGFAVGMITPGRIGDFYRVVYVKNEKRNSKSSWGMCFATVFLDRILDIIIMLFFAGIGLFYLLYQYEIPFGRQLEIAIVILFVLGIIFLFVFRQELVSRVIRPLFYKFVPEKYHVNMKLNYSAFFSLFHSLMKQPFRISMLFVIGLLGWFIAIFQAYVLALAMNLDVSYIFILSIVPILNIVELLPISFSGIGTREATMIFFMGLISISKEAAVAFSLLILITVYILAIPGLLYWLKHPTKMAK